MIIRGVRQVRTSSNAYSGVRYDLDGNIIVTKAQRKAHNKALDKNRAQLKAKKNKKKWIKIENKFQNACVICGVDIKVGEKILWNWKTKKIKHVGHESEQLTIAFTPSSDAV